MARISSPRSPFYFLAAAFLFAAPLAVGCGAEAPITGDEDNIVPADAATLFDQAGVCDAILERHATVRDTDLKDGSIRWNCGDVAGVTASDRGQEYCEYNAVSKGARLVPHLGWAQLQGAAAPLEQLSAGEVGYSSLGGMTFSKLTGITIKGTDYLAAIKANGQTLDNVPADTIFGLFAPERGFADNMITEELLRRNLLSKDTLADLLVADLTNPVFSTERCGLAATAPDAGADAIRAEWVKNLETSTLKGAAALKARLAKTDDFAANQATIDAFVNATT